MKIICPLCKRNHIVSNTYNPETDGFYRCDNCKNKDISRINSPIPWNVQLPTKGIDIHKLDEIILGKKDEDLLYDINPETGDIHKIILYITQRTESLIEKKRWGFPKYHLYHCETIEEYKKNLKNKYKISSRQDGLFYFMVLNASSKEVKKVIEDQPLDLCKNCLSIYNEICGHNKTINSFDLKEFFQTNFSQFYPDEGFEYDFDTIPNIYSNNWKDFADKRKQQCNYTCQLCNIKLDTDKEKKYLHAHHKDRKKYNNKYDNIQILCIKCHAEQDNHAFIKDLPDYREFELFKQSS